MNARPSSETRRDNGQPLSLGSGFCVGDGKLASNIHAIAGAARGYAKLVGEKTKYDIEGIAALSPETDLVVVKISGGCSQALSLGNSDAVQVGDSVYAVGNPQSLEGTFSQGIVSSIRELGSNKLLQITAPISPGSSGGPVLNEKGEVGRGQSEGDRKLSCRRQHGRCCHLRLRDQSLAEFAEYTAGPTFIFHLMFSQHHYVNPSHCGDGCGVGWGCDKSLLAVKSSISSDALLYRSRSRSACGASPSFTCFSRFPSASL